MWAPLLLSILLAVVTPSGQAVDPCAPATLPLEDATCGDAPLCSARRRVELVCELRGALERRYVFLDAKEALARREAWAPLGTRGHLDACVAEERDIVREDDPLRFYDRVRRCTAAFRDGHLVLGAAAALPRVALGIGLRLVEGKVVVANREEGLVQRLAGSGATDAERLLATGTEVVEIDGRPVREVLDDLSAHIPASSPAARLERAVDALTDRDFAFPAKATAALSVSVSGERRTIQLPWSIAPGAERHAMTRAYVERTGIAPRARRPAEGHARTDTILGGAEATSLQEYRDGDGRPAVRAGEIHRSGARAFCYLQVLSFHTSTLSGPGGVRPYASVLDGLVRGCRDGGLDLVLDLRHNGGGYLSNATALVAALLPAGGSAPSGALLLRASGQNREVFEARSAGAMDGLEPRRVLDAIAASRRAGRPFTPAFADAPVRPSEGVGGYDRRVVALVSPSCMSACDRAVAMLRGAGRAVLVGGPSEGAGGSQQESPGVGTAWRDARRLVSVRIPNAAMGVQRARTGADATGEIAAEQFFDALSFENRPVEPDVPYATSLEDVTGENRGWLGRVEEILSAPELPLDAGRPQGRDRA